LKVDFGKKFEKQLTKKARLTIIWRLLFHELLYSETGLGFSFINYSTKAIVNYIHMNMFLFLYAYENRVQALLCLALYDFEP